MGVSDAVVVVGLLAFMVAWATVFLRALDGDDDDIGMVAALGLLLMLFVPVVWAGTYVGRLIP